MIKVDIVTVSTTVIRWYYFRKNESIAIFASVLQYIIRSNLEIYLAFSSVCRNLERTKLDSRVKVSRNLHSVLGSIIINRMYVLITSERI